MRHMLCGAGKARPGSLDLAATQEAHLRKAATSVWCVSDGTAGMRYQSLALAAIMGWDQNADFRDIVVTPHPILRHLPRLGHWVPGLPLTQDATPLLPQSAESAITPVFWSPAVGVWPACRLRSRHALVVMVRT